MDRSAGLSLEISTCTKRDYDRIIEDLPDFWDGRDTRQLHHPMLVNEFGNSAFVIRSGDKIAAYLFGFISQTAPVGYVHAIAVRSSARRRRLGHKLFDHFVVFARSRAVRTSRL
jgi:GNAT superfamily N-acetyltransferase